MKVVIISVWAYIAIKMMASNTQEWLPLAGENCSLFIYKMPPARPKMWQTWLTTGVVSLRWQEMETYVHDLYLFPSCSGGSLESVAMEWARNGMGRNSKGLEEAGRYAWRQKGRWECSSTVLSLLWCFAESSAFGRVNKLMCSVINRGIKFRHGNYSAWLFHL